MVHKFDFQELDLKGAYLIQPFYATDAQRPFCTGYEANEHGEV